MKGKLCADFRVVNKKDDLSGIVSLIKQDCGIETAKGYGDDVARGARARARSAWLDTGFGTAGFGAAGFGTAGFGTVRFGTAGFGTAGFGTAGCGTARFRTA